MKVKRIFECKNGHRYESKQPITTEWFAKRFRGKSNTNCKICGEVIIKEEDFVKGKHVMGAVRI